MNGPSTSQRVLPGAHNAKEGRKFLDDEMREKRLGTAAMLIALNPRVHLVSGGGLHPMLGPVQRLWAATTCGDALIRTLHTWYAKFGALAKTKSS